MTALQFSALRYWLAGAAMGAVMLLMAGGATGVLIGAAVLLVFGLYGASTKGTIDADRIEWSRWLETRSVAIQDIAEVEAKGAVLSVRRTDGQLMRIGPLADAAAVAKEIEAHRARPPESQVIE